MPASRPAKGWSISKSWAIEPPSGSAYDAAYIVRLVHGEEATHDLVVEFEAPSALASVGYAEEIARRLIRSGGGLPNHVVVETSGSVQVVGESTAGASATEQ